MSTPSRAIDANLNVLPFGVRAEGIAMMATSSVPVGPGDVIAGKYVVERVLGTGGMGFVVAARHEQLEQLVAIKLMRNDTVAHGDSVTRFLREARAAAKLKSEHVARVLDVGTLEGGAPYMVMEYLEGCDLGQLLIERGPMPVDATVRLLLQACEAVAEAHAAGIIHRDLKPQNLFLTHAVDGSPKLKVLDFGISKAVGQANLGRGANLTGTRVMLGSPYYMAPEQMMSSRDVDERVDIWALGIVLFELLTGRCPFEADTMPGLCHKVVNDPTPAVAELRADVPHGLCAIIERCLMKDPAQRFASAEDLASALGRFALVPRRYTRHSAHDPAAASSSRSSGPPFRPHAESATPSSHSRSRPPSSRRRAPTAVWTIASVLAGATLLAAVGMRRREPLDPSRTPQLAVVNPVASASSAGLPSSPAASLMAPEFGAAAASALSASAVEGPAGAPSNSATLSVEAHRHPLAISLPMRGPSPARSVDPSIVHQKSPSTDVDGIPTRR